MKTRFRDIFGAVFSVPRYGRPSCPISPRNSPAQAKSVSRFAIIKWPAVYWEKGTISDSAHFQFPHDLLPGCECCIGILHCKFIDHDLETYKSRALDGSGFSGGPNHYKLYVGGDEENGNPGSLFADSIVFKGSESMKKVSLLSDMQPDKADWLRPAAARR